MLYSVSFIFTLEDGWLLYVSLAKIQTHLENTVENINESGLVGQGWCHSKLCLMLLWYRPTYDNAALRGVCLVPSLSDFEQIISVLRFLSEFPYYGWSVWVKEGFKSLLLSFSVSIINTHQHSAWHFICKLPSFI